MGSEGSSEIIDIPGKNWESLLPPSDHPEYPSATASFCSVVAEMARLWWPAQNDKIGPVVTHIVPQDQENQYLVEPQSSYLKIMSKYDNIMYKPRPNSMKSRSVQFSTWSDFENNCGASRVYGGLNFNDTITISKTFGKQFAADAISYINDRLHSGMKDSQDDNYYYGKTLWPSLLFL